VCLCVCVSVCLCVCVCCVVWVACVCFWCCDVCVMWDVYVCDMCEDVVCVCMCVRVCYLMWEKKWASEDDSCAWHTNTGGFCVRQNCSSSPGHFHLGVLGRQASITMETHNDIHVTRSTTTNLTQWRQPHPASHWYHW